MTNQTIAIQGPTQEQNEKLDYLESFGFLVESFTLNDGRCIASFTDGYDYEIDLDDFELNCSREKIFQVADIYSCCGDILDRDIMMCPTCKEHC